MRLPAVKQWRRATAWATELPLAVIAAVVTTAERSLEMVNEGAEINRPVRGKLVNLAEELLAFRDDVPEMFRGL